MMSSLETSSPVSASTLAYLMLTGILVDLVEADLLALKRRRKEGHRAGDQGKAQEALPIGAGCHRETPTQLNSETQYRRRAKGRKVPKNESSTLWAGVSDRLHDVVEGP